MLIPPLAVGHRVAGEWQHRNADAEPPLAVLLDRDDTLIEDGPYLNDPRGVVPMPGARRALDRLRARGLLLAIVTNQSGVARGLITPSNWVRSTPRWQVSSGRSTAGMCACTGGRRLRLPQACAGHGGGRSGRAGCSAAAVRAHR